jgi:hypothetical protein
MDTEKWVKLLSDKNADIDLMQKEIINANPEELKALNQKVLNYFKDNWLKSSQNDMTKQRLLESIQDVQQNIAKLSIRFSELYREALKDKNLDKKKFYMELNGHVSMTSFYLGEFSNDLSPPSLSTMPINDLFTKVGLNHSRYSSDAVAAEVISRMDHVTPDSAILHGPLNKSKYTYALEELVQAILTNQGMEFSLNDKKEPVLLVGRDKKIFYINEIIKHADLSHINIADSNLQEAYIDFLKNKAINKPTFEEKLGVFITEQEFIDRDLKQVSGNLSYAEKCAINLYTGAECSDMNQLLRGSPNLGHNPLLSLQTAILNVSFCASGLNKIPVQSYSFAIRSESLLPQPILDQRLAAVENADITFERGFVSTSSAAINIQFDGPVKILFTGGILGQDISHLSYYPGEAEVLMIPTQMKWSGYTEQNGKYYLHAQPVRTLSGLSVESQAVLEKVSPAQASFLPSFDTKTKQTKAKNNFAQENVPPVVSTEPEAELTRLKK